MRAGKAIRPIIKFAGNEEQLQTEAAATDNITDTQAPRETSIMERYKSPAGNKFRFAG